MADVFLSYKEENRAVAPDALGEVDRAGLSLEFVTGGGLGAASERALPPQALAAAETEDVESDRCPHEPGLDQPGSFDTFIVGTSSGHSSNWAGLRDVTRFALTSDDSARLAAYRQTARVKSVGNFVQAQARDGGSALP